MKRRMKAQSEEAKSNKQKAKAKILSRTMSMSEQRIRTPPEISPQREGCYRSSFPKQFWHIAVSKFPPGGPTLVVVVVVV